MFAVYITGKIYRQVLYHDVVQYVSEIRTPTVSLATIKEPEVEFKNKQLG